MSNEIRRSTLMASTTREALLSASRALEGTADECIWELLDNARRAGATKVTVTCDGHHVKVSDNGMGIADPEVVIRLGESWWPSTEGRWRAAPGIGLYRLGRRPATIRSRAMQPNGKCTEAWSMDIDERVRDGRQAAIIRHGVPEPVGQGTIVEFVGDQDRGMLSHYSGKVTWSVKQMLEYYPVATTWNGAAVPRRKFLDGARRIRTEDADFPWPGIRIGIFVTTGAGGPTSTMVNCNGRQAELRDCQPLVAQNVRIWARIEVADDQLLHATATRERMVIAEGPAANPLREQVRKALYTEAAALQREHETPFDHRQQQVGAELFGVELAAPRPRLPRWSADPDAAGDDDVQMNDRMMVVHEQLDPATAASVSRALEQAGEGAPILVQGRAGYAGYKWYDELRGLDRVDRRVRTDADGWRDLALEGDSPGESSDYENERVEEAVVVLVSSEGMYEKPTELQTDLVFNSTSGHRSADELGAKLTRGSTIGEQELADLMTAAASGGELDEEGRESEEHADVAAAAAAELLGGAAHAARTRILRLVQRHVRQAVPKGAAARIRIDGLDVQVDIDAG